MFRLTVIFCIFSLFLNRGYSLRVSDYKKDYLELREAKKLEFADRVAKLLIDQSTEQNINWKKSFEELKSLSHSQLAAEVFCDRLHFEPFLDYLNRTRRELDIAEPNAEVRTQIENVTYQQTRFDISFALINPMQFLVIESFKIIAVEQGKDVWKLADIVATGSCLHAKTIKQKNIIDLWKIKSGMSDEGWDFAENVSTVLPFLINEKDPDLTLNYDLFHPDSIFTIGNNLTYLFNEHIPMERYLVIMERFAKRFPGARLSTSDLSEITSANDHIVFRSRKTLRYPNELVQSWQFQVEGAFNGTGDETWLVTQMHITPPKEFVTALEFLLDLNDFMLKGTKARNIGCSTHLDNVIGFLAHIGEKEFEAQTILDILTWRPKANFELSYYYKDDEYVNIWFHASYNLEKYTIDDYHICIPTRSATPTMLNLLKDPFKTNSGLCGKSNI